MGSSASVRLIDLVQLEAQRTAVEKEKEKSSRFEVLTHRIKSRHAKVKFAFGDLLR